MLLVHLSSQILAWQRRRQSKLLSGGVKFRASAFTLDRPPVPPANASDLQLGIPCWRAVSMVYVDGKATELPHVVGSMRVYSTDFAKLGPAVKHACKLVKMQERSRTKRDLSCGEHSVSLAFDLAGNHRCSGSYYFEVGGQQKKLV